MLVWLELPRKAVGIAVLGAYLLWTHAGHLLAAAPYLQMMQAQMQSGQVQRAP
jgi:hypothetical protein